jgi:hypothetical protein
MEPGGSGDPYAGLTPHQQNVLREVSTLGIPLRGWWQHATLGGGSFGAVASAVRILDPAYVTDFWSTPGYEGADPTSTAAGARVQHDTRVTALIGSPPVGVSVASAPAARSVLIGADLVVTSGAAAGMSVPIETVDGTTVTFGAAADPSVTAVLAPGDRVRVDTSWTVALEYYARHQVPTADMYGWNQYRDGAGNAIPPQRPLLTGPFLAQASGGIATGRLNGKMIMLASVMDMEAYSWSADWYRKRAMEAKGAEIDSSYRLWFMDNADHTSPPTTYANTHLVPYEGALQQALLDLDAWVVHGTPPPSSSRYSVDAQSQVSVPATADRGGVQPVVDLSVRPGSPGSSPDQDEGRGSPPGERVEVRVGQPVTLSAAAEVPPGTGRIVAAEWDFEGTGERGVPARIDRPSTSERLTATYRFTKPGTYFPVVRVTSQRDGDTDTPYGLVSNLARARVIVD